jgi:hypothetical protein
MMISMQLISLFIIEEGDLRSIIMIDHSLWSNIKCIHLKWEGLKVMHTIQRDSTNFLKGKGVTMSKTIDNKDSSNMNMKE